MKIGKILTIGMSMFMILQLSIAVEQVKADDPPDIQFEMDDINNTLTVVSVDPDDVLWSNIDISGDCMYIFMTYVTSGDHFTDCYGTITLTYIPTTTTIGTWEFSPTQSGDIIYVDDDGGADYTSIQDAVYAANEGDTIYVYSGTYQESVGINKRITLWGEDKETTIIDNSGNVDDSAIRLYNDVYGDANGCTIKGFTIKAEKARGTIQLSGVSDIFISDNKVYGGLKIIGLIGSTSKNNIITNNVFQEYGIYLQYYSSNPTDSYNIISGNIISNFYDNAIEVEYSNYNTIEDNTITNCNGYGLFLGNSHHNIIKDNVIKNNGIGIHLSVSDYNSIYSNIISMNEYQGIQGHGINSNSIYDNTITDNNPSGESYYYGLKISGYNSASQTVDSYNNLIYGNTFSGNTNNAFDKYTNDWDNGYPLGNYWDNYFGSDKNKDGIGDIPYNIPGGNSVDHYPRGYFTPSFGLGYDSSNKQILIVSFESGYHYSDSHSYDDAHIVFIKDYNPQNVYYVLDDLTVGTSGSLSTKEIQADDTISGFPYGSYEMLWQPAGETLLEFTVEAPIIESKGWIYGTMLAKTPDEGTFPLEGVLIEVWNLSGEFVNSSYTDSNGYYEIHDLELGTYNVTTTYTNGVTLKRRTIIKGARGHKCEYMRETLPNLELINEAIEKGDVGAKISIRKDQVNIFEHNISIYNGVEIKNLDIKKGSISFTVSGNETGGGKTIVIDIVGSVFDPSSEILVKYDGESIDMADDITDILDPNDDGSHPEYLIVIGSDGAQLLVSIPHFSEHSITFFNLEPEQVAQYIQYAIIAAVGIIAIAAVIMFRKGKED